MRKKIMFLVAITLMGGAAVTVHAGNNKAIKVPSQTSSGIVHTTDDSVYIDSEDIKSLRVAVNTNADLLNGALGVVENKKDGQKLETPEGSPKIQCEYTAADNHLKITLR